MARGVADRAALDHRRSRRHADHDMAALDEAARAALRLVHEILQHLLGDVDVGDDAVAQGTDRLDIVGGLAHHRLGFVAADLDPADAIASSKRTDRRILGAEPVALGRWAWREKGWR